MKYKKIISLVFLSAFLLGACETMDLDQTENPSAANPNLLDPVFAFNDVQIRLADFVDNTNSFTQRIMRHMAMTGGNTYDNAFAPVNFNGHWSTGYRILNAIKILEPKASSDRNNYILGASKVIRCYVLMTLVDVYGDIPYTEATLGSANITPRYDDDQLVYEGIVNELDAAIETLETAGNDDAESRTEDLYYSSKTNWIVLANTLKLKIYNNCNLLTTLGGKNIASEVNAIINEDKYIDTIEEDFAFRYGNSRFTPNSRHPLYNDQYELGGGAYIGNYLMWTMTSEKPNNSSFENTISDPGDPRVTYYFQKRSNPADADAFTLPGRLRPEHYGSVRYNSFYTTTGTPYSVSNWTGQNNIPANGYWGRDHGNNAGIPPDNEDRTVGGSYPIGGINEGNEYESSINFEDGKQGAGIMPMVLSSFVHFMKAELILKGILPGGQSAAKSELNIAISQSIDKTTGLYPDYPVLTGPERTELADKKAKYLTFIGDTWETLNEVDRLELVIKEYYIATWGNGIEPYNNYRRTGFPSNLQPSLEPIAGEFYNRGLYSADAVNNNPNTPTNDRTRKVFWAEPNDSELY